MAVEVHKGPSGKAWPLVSELSIKITGTGPKNPWGSSIYFPTLSDSDGPTGMTGINPDWDKG
jgi:hypothetical protein